MTTRPKNTSPHSASLFSIIESFWSLFSLFFLWIFYALRFRQVIVFNRIHHQLLSFFFLLDFSSFFSCRHIQAEQQHLIDTLVIIDVWTKQHTHTQKTAVIVAFLGNTTTQPPVWKWVSDLFLVPRISLHAPPIKWNNFDQLCTLLHSLCFTLRKLNLMHCCCWRENGMEKRFY